jgi:hypothetical protein
MTVVAAAAWALALSAGAADAEEPAADVSRVTSAAQGHILCLGTEVDPTTLTAARKKALLAAGKLIMVRTEFRAIEAKGEEAQRGPDFKVKGDNRSWRRWTDKDPLEPGRLNVVQETRTFLRLERGTPVRNGQLLGLLAAWRSAAVDLKRKVEARWVTGAWLDCSGGIRL